MANFKKVMLIVHVYNVHICQFFYTYSSLASSTAADTHNTLYINCACALRINNPAKLMSLAPQLCWIHTFVIESRFLFVGGDALAHLCAMRT